MRKSRGLKAERVVGKTSVTWPEPVPDPRVTRGGEEVETPPGNSRGAERGRRVQRVVTRSGRVRPGRVARLFYLDHADILALMEERMARARIGRRGRESDLSTLVREAIRAVYGGRGGARCGRSRAKPRV